MMDIGILIGLIGLGATALGFVIRAVYFGYTRRRSKREDLFQSDLLNACQALTLSLAKAMRKFSTDLENKDSSYFDGDREEVIKRAENDLQHRITTVLQLGIQEIEKVVSLYGAKPLSNEDKIVLSGMAAGIKIDRSEIGKSDGTTEDYASVAAGFIGIAFFGPIWAIVAAITWLVFQMNKKSRLIKKITNGVNKRADEQERNSAAYAAQMLEAIVTELRVGSVSTFTPDARVDSLLGETPTDVSKLSS